MSTYNDEIVQKQSRLSPFIKQCTIATGVLLNNIVHGSGMAFPAVLLPQLRSSSIRLSREDESWVASILVVAMFAGNLLTMPTMRRGRKLTLYLVSLLNITGWIIIALASDIQVLMIGRFVQGLSIGLLISVISVIVAEYTSPAHRGGFLAAISLTQGLGVFFAHFVGSFMAWRDTALLLGCLPVISFAITVFTPETPSWLAIEGRYDECRKTYRWLRGHQEEDELNKMIHERQHFDSLADSRGAAFREVALAMTQKELYIPLVIGIAMSVLLTCGGAMIMASYLNEIVGELLGPECNVVTWMGTFDGIRLVCNCTSLYVVERIQRRTLLFSTGATCVLAHFATSAYIYAKNAGLIDANIWLPATLFICHVITIGLGMVSLPFVILGEIFPLQYRGLCSFIFMVVLVVSMFVVTKTFPALVASAGLEGAWLAYGATLALALIIPWYLLPETRGRTLQDIEEHFRRELINPADVEAKRALTGTTEEKLIL